MSDDPAKLLRAYLDQDARAAEQLAARALRIALRTAAAMLANRGLVDDIAQDVATQVLRGAHGIRQPDQLDAWIRRVAVRETMRVSRRTRRRAQREVPLDDLPAAFDVATSIAPDHAAQRRELTESLRGALALLPEKQRMALVLRYVHDLTHDQIADAMGIRPGTAGALISRGRAALRSMEALEQFAAEGGES